MVSSRVKHLLRAVALRQNLASWARVFHVTFLGLCGAYLVLLLVTRFLGVIPNWFPRPPRTGLDYLYVCGTLALPALLAVGAAFLIARRADARAAARAVDVSAGTNDLFLTGVMIEQSIGGFAPVVLHRAEARARDVRSREVVRLDWRRKTLYAISAPILLVLCGLFLPQLDPFGREAGRRQLAQKQKQISVMREEAKKKLALFDDKAAKAQNSKEVERAFDQLKADFRKLTPKDKKGSLKRLGNDKEEIGGLWKKRNEEKLRDALARKPVNQQFGGGELQKQAQWAKDLKEGKTDRLQKEIKKISELAKKLAAAKDGAAKKELERELQKQLAGLNDFMKKGVSSERMQQAMERAGVEP